MEYKNIIILSGGGFKASYQIGVLKALEIEHDITPDVLIGTSGGAINAAVLSQHSIDHTYNLWKDIATVGNTGILESLYIDVDSLKLNLKRIRKRILPKLKLSLIWSKKSRVEYKEGIKNNIQSLNGLCSLNPLRTRLEKELRREDMLIPTYFNFVSLVSGEEVTLGIEDLSYTKDIIDAVIASASVPIYIEPTEVVEKTGKKHYKCVDGGMSSNTNISKALQYIKTNFGYKYRIIIINCNEDVKREQPRGIIEFFDRVITDVMLKNLFNKDFNGLTKINSVIDSFKKSKVILADSTKLYKIPITHIQPTEDIGTIFQNNLNFFNNRYNNGYKDGKNKRFNL